MIVVAYYLSRCGVRIPNRRCKPPRSLRVKTWKSAYDTFFDVLGDGRTRSQFRNSLKNVRDTFDTLFDNGRRGWVNKDGQTPALSPAFSQVHNQWKGRKDQELEASVLDLRMDKYFSFSDRPQSQQLRTEGGQKVFVSLKPERDWRTRADAISLHGHDCMGCGFNFGDFYGEVGRGFIEVHHVIPLADSGQRETNPLTDLIVLCANCHRVVHRNSDICLSLDELRTHIANAAS